MNDKEKLEEYFLTAGFLIIMVIAVIAAFQLYFSLQKLIGIWFDYTYQPLFEALYSLAVLAITLYFIRTYILKKKT